MLRLQVGSVESFNEETNEFVMTGGRIIELEHSLFSLSKWEENWEVPFLGPQEKTTEQTVDYIRCMVVSPDVDPSFVSELTPENIREVNDYIQAKRTATWIREAPDKPGSQDIITSEIFYYWMVVGQIDFQCQYWHLNRLMTLIRVISEKQSDKKGKRKISPEQRAAEQRAMNEKRRAQHKTKG